MEIQIFHAEQKKSEIFFCFCLVRQPKLSGTNWFFQSKNWNVNIFWFHFDKILVIFLIKSINSSFRPHEFAWHISAPHAIDIILLIRRTMLLIMCDNMMNYDGIIEVWGEWNWLELNCYTFCIKNKREFMWWNWPQTFAEHAITLNQWFICSFQIDVDWWQQNDNWQSKWTHTWN